MCQPVCCAGWKWRVRTTYLSCSCDISVGRTGLSSWYWKSDPSSLRWKHWMRAAATNKVSLTERTGFVGFSRFLGNAEKLRPVLPVTRPRIGLQVGRGAGPRCPWPLLSLWLAQLVAYLTCGGTSGTSASTVLYSCDLTYWHINKKQYWSNYMIKKKVKKEKKSIWIKIKFPSKQNFLYHL